MELNNSTLLITGGSSGIGLEFVKQLQKLHATIIITGRDQAKLEQVKKQYPQVHVFQNDVSNVQDIGQLYEQVTKQFPQLNIIINNAGIMRNMDLQDTGMSLENITREIDTNLSGIIRVVHQFLPHLRTKPSAAIINVSSGLAFVPFSAAPVYSATKSGVHAYTQALRLQLKNTAVKVFELAPPGTETPLMDEFRNVVDSNQNMKVDKMVRIAIKGILNDTLEIRPGLSNVLKIMSRLAPKFIAGMLDRTIEKAKKQKK
ncbi:MAG: SDR family oxidoreductase [Bacteroidia bacterium]